MELHPEIGIGGRSHPGLIPFSLSPSTTFVLANHLSSVAIKAPPPLPYDMDPSGSHTTVTLLEYEITSLQGSSYIVLQQIYILAKERGSVADLMYIPIHLCNSLLRTLIQRWIGKYHVESNVHSMSAEDGYHPFPLSRLHQFHDYQFRGDLMR